MEKTSVKQMCELALRLRDELYDEIGKLVKNYVLSGKPDMKVANLVIKRMPNNMAWILPEKGGKEILFTKLQYNPKDNKSYITGTCEGEKVSRRIDQMSLEDLKDLAGFLENFSSTEPSGNTKERDEEKAAGLKEAAKEENGKKNRERKHEDKDEEPAGSEERNTEREEPEGATFVGHAIEPSEGVF